jgi:hypothetical protein
MNPHQARREGTNVLPSPRPKLSRLARSVASAMGLALLLLPGLSRAQSYSVDWFTIDAGGGTSTGSVYSVTGTIGQPDAGAMTGGGYTLQGGFWGILAAVQTPGAPRLTITPTPTNTMVISWPADSESWVLERTNALPALAVASWPQVPLPYQTNNGTISVTLPTTPPTGNQFFRLRKP